MKRRYLVIIGISAFLLFYFLVPFIEGGEWCYVKDPESNKPKLEEAATGKGINFSLFGYTVVLLTGGEHETNGGICITSIP
jgi:hypothetical protein